MGCDLAVLVNCYNYESFIGDCIRSVGQQTVAPKELLVVDDGSSDQSVAVAEEACREIGLGEVKTFPNGGQLAAIERGLEASQSEWVVFLDADDLFEANHLEILEEQIRKNPKVDFFFTKHQEFGDGEGKGFCYRGSSGDLGYSAALVLAGCRHTNAFVGGVTSTLCIRRQLLERFLPLGKDYWSDWKTRADNVLVLGTSVVGARKFHIEETTVRYRIHGGNHFAGSERQRIEQCANGQSTSRLFGVLRQRVPYGPHFNASLAFEYLSIPDKNDFMKKGYLKAIWANGGTLRERVRGCLKVLKEGC